MNDPRAEAGRWLDQAENDMDFARYALKGGFFNQVCFIAQQCAEKALKALLYLGGARNVVGPSAVGLLGRLAVTYPELEVIRDPCAELDLYYIPTRYPNGLVEGTPHGAFTRTQAERAIESAGEVPGAVRRLLGSHAP